MVENSGGPRPHEIVSAIAYNERFNNDPQLGKLERLKGLPVIGKVFSRIQTDQLTMGEEAAKVERRDAQHEIEELRTLSTKDHLTGLLNELGFREGIDNSVARIVREHASDTDAEVFMITKIDVRYFKAFNDLFGWSVGNEYLRLLAQCVDHVRPLREYDLFARLGGDDFPIASSLSNTGNNRPILASTTDEGGLVRGLLATGDALARFTAGEKIEQIPVLNKVAATLNLQENYFQTHNLSREFNLMVAISKGEILSDTDWEYIRQQPDFSKNICRISGVNKQFTNQDDFTEIREVLNKKLMDILRINQSDFDDLPTRDAWKGLGIGSFTVASASFSADSLQKLWTQYQKVLTSETEKKPDSFYDFIETDFILTGINLAKGEHSPTSRFVGLDVERQNIVQYPLTGNEIPAAIVNTWFGAGGSEDKVAYKVLSMYLAELGFWDDKDRVYTGGQDCVDSLVQKLMKKSANEYTRGFEDFTVATLDVEPGEEALRHTQEVVYRNGGVLIRTHDNLAYVVMTNKPGYMGHKDVKKNVNYPVERLIESLTSARVIHGFVCTKNSLYEALHGGYFQTDEKHGGDIRLQELVSTDGGKGILEHLNIGEGTAFEEGSESVIHGIIVPIIFDKHTQLYSI